MRILPTRFQSIFSFPEMATRSPPRQRRTKGAYVSVCFYNQIFCLTVFLFLFRSWRFFLRREWSDRERHGRERSLILWHFMSGGRSVGESDRERSLARAVALWFDPEERGRERSDRRSGRVLGVSTLVGQGAERPRVLFVRAVARILIQREWGRERSDR